jgi:hypothetical protein
MALGLARAQISGSRPLKMSADRAMLRLSKKLNFEDVTTIKQDWTNNEELDVGLVLEGYKLIGARTLHL